MPNMFRILHLLYVMAGVQSSHHERTNQLPDRSTIVHLFEWKYEDVADECERFLGPKGFGGVQISPPSENLIIHLEDGSRPWYERYQVMSYNLTTRSGDEADFLDMTRRCNKAGVRIYADVVVNHMTGDYKENIGTGGSTADFKKSYYPAVPYTQEHFHTSCPIDNYNDPFQVRNCKLVGLKDLNQTINHVQQRKVNFFRKLIRSGVAGLRMDAAKHMWPEDLKKIYEKLDHLNTEFGFPPKSKPYIYHEVIVLSANEKIQPQEYTPMGDVTEFRVGRELSNAFRGNNPLKWLVSWGEAWGLSPSETALVFIDNHDTQRAGLLNYKEAKAYKGAIAFMLAHPYGEPKVISSFRFDKIDQGPPSDNQGNIISPTINKDDTCNNGWVCEHRWRQIYQMVGLRNVVRDTLVHNWWDNGNNQIAFSRGNKGFIAFNLEGRDFDQTLQTGLPPGDYCDIISGIRIGNHCTGRNVTVNSDGYARIVIPSNAEDMHIAIHVGTECSLQTTAAPS